MFTQPEIKTVERLCDEVREILDQLVEDRRIPPHELEKGHEEQTADRKAYVDLTRAHRHLQRCILNAEEVLREAELAAALSPDQIQKLERAGVRIK